VKTRHENCTENNNGARAGNRKRKQLRDAREACRTSERASDGVGRRFVIGERVRRTVMRPGLPQQQLQPADVTLAVVFQLLTPATYPGRHQVHRQV